MNFSVFIRNTERHHTPCRSTQREIGKPRHTLIHLNSLRTTKARPHARCFVHIHRAHRHLKHPVTQHLRKYPPPRSCLDSLFVSWPWFSLLSCFALVLLVVLS